MRNKKIHEICLFIIVCILINYVGKTLAESQGLPLWLDSFGTILTAYCMGPVYGAMVGAAVNIIYGFNSSVSFIYALTNIAIGVTVGICAKKGFFKDLFQVLSASFLVTMISVILSTPLNCIFYGGRTGNKWGDGVIDLLQKMECNKLLSYIIGEFYVDFLDKVILMLVLFGFIKLHQRYKQKTVIKTISMFLVLVISFHFGCPYVPVQAENVQDEPEEENDYNSYVQTIYNGNNGLPGGKANAIVETKDDILWVGTYGGLYRYSGSEYIWMDEFESVKNVNCLYTDEEGRLWIGTNDNGLSICVEEDITNVVTMEEGLPSNSVRCITKGMEENYYVGTTDSLAVLNMEGELSVTGTIPEIVYANSISVDSQGNVAVVTNGGELYLVKDTEILDKKNLIEQGKQYTCCVFARRFLQNWTVK